jgi:hypothetical protein
MEYDSYPEHPQDKESIFSLFTPFNVFTASSIIILFSLVIYIFSKDWTGPRGPPGPDTDLSNYKGDVNISGNIVASGIVKSGDCKLSCNTSTDDDSGSGKSTTALVIIVVILSLSAIGGGVYYYKYRT